MKLDHHLESIADLAILKRLLHRHHDVEGDGPKRMKHVSVRVMTWRYTTVQDIAPVGREVRPGAELTTRPAGQLRHEQDH